MKEQSVNKNKIILKNIRLDICPTGIKMYYKLLIIKTLWPMWVIENRLKNIKTKPTKIDLC